ncbi:P1 family peptidase [Mesorhizobium sp.]|uniref:P1 family peptidase n=1 Tax=Mesorhizobium sp. TaxID=1871066 RepID=UPI00257E0A20|nr:P1 family peptidase [Mesorhizobium sp.]
MPNNKLDPLFEAAAQAVEEANAMVAAESMVGREDRFVAAIEHDALRKLMRTYGRLNG